LWPITLNFIGKLSGQTITHQEGKQKLINGISCPQRESALQLIIWLDENLMHKLKATEKKLQVLAVNIRRSSLR
jgi:hypothetical protein